MSRASSPMPRIGIPFGDVTTEREARKQQYYLDAVRASGGEPILVSTADPPACILQIASTLEGILLPGSPADVNPQLYDVRREPQCAAPDPAREQTDYQLLELAFREAKPVLAICYGVQILNVFRGGTLIQHIDGHEGGILHEVRCEPHSLVTELAGGSVATVNSFHHQAVAHQGQGLRLVAHAADGTIEAVEGENGSHFLVGVQWHPERDFDSSLLSRALFERFVRAAAK